jgi:hypothetical protein
MVKPKSKKARESDFEVIDYFKARKGKNMREQIILIFLLSILSCMSIAFTADFVKFYCRYYTLSLFTVGMTVFSWIMVTMLSDEISKLGDKLDSEKELMLWR